jgi:hypothetical protein
LVLISTEYPLLLLCRLRESGMNATKTKGIDGFKVPSVIPQDILLIQDLVGGDLPEASSSSQTNVLLATRTAKAEEEDANSITSSSGENLLDEGGDVDMLRAGASALKEEVDKGGDSEEEVEAGLLGKGDEGEPMTM